MQHGLKFTTALAVLLFLASLPAAGGAAADGFAAAGRRSPMTQRSGKSVKGGRAAEALAPGVWGGEHIRFEVTERGADIEYDCAHGTVEGRIVVDRQGRFSVAGMYYEEHGGPVRVGEEAGGYPVRLTGRVGGSLL